jgi:hypothetical protein
MGKLKYILVTFILGTLFFYTCEVPRSYPDTPEVKFKSLFIADSVDLLDNKVKLVQLTISVIDGDGDVGIKFADGVYPGFEDLDTSDMFITLYEKINGEFVEVELAAADKFKLPYLEPEGQDKTLKADYEVSIEYSDTLFVYDTIKYSFYIYDRAKHKSNIAESPEIPADTLGLIE